MDTPLPMSTLQAHSAYLLQLTTELTTLLTTLDHALQRQTADGRAIFQPLCAKLTELQGLLAVETEVLCQRLSTWLGQRLQLHTNW